MDIDLDKHFRADSEARKVAQKLLTGKAHTRQQLVANTNLSVTTVNRVVEVLTEAGAVIVRDIAEDGRQARFRLTSIGDPKKAKAYPTIQDKAKIVRAEILGDDTMVDFTIESVRYRGALQGLSRQAPLGKVAKIMGVSLDSAGAAVVALDIDGKSTLKLANVHNVSAD